MTAIMGRRRRTRWSTPASGSTGGRGIASPPPSRCRIWGTRTSSSTCLATSRSGRLSARCVFTSEARNRTRAVDLTIRLLALDIDGTILDSHGALPEANRDAIAQAIEAGVEVALATGRRYDFARAIFE